MGDTRIQLIAGYTASIFVNRAAIIVIMGILWGWEISLGAVLIIYVVSKVATKSLYTYLRATAEKGAKDRAQTRES
jgi:hypothetical protein